MKSLQSKSSSIHLQISFKYRLLIALIYKCMITPSEASERYLTFSRVLFNPLRLKGDLVVIEKKMLHKHHFTLYRTLNVKLDSWIYSTIGDILSKHISIQIQIQGTVLCMK